MPDRTGNQPDLFGDIKKGDICTAAPCWLGKRNATLVNLATASAQELGVKSVLKVGIGHATWNESKAPVDVYIGYNSEARIVKEGMHRYHPGHYSGLDRDPLKPLVNVYRVDAAAIGKRIKGETSEKVVSIQASLKKRKAKLPPEKSAAAN